MREFLFSNKNAHVKAKKDYQKLILLFSIAGALGFFKASVENMNSQYFIIGTLLGFLLLVGIFLFGFRIGINSLAKRILKDRYIVGDSFIEKISSYKVVKISLNEIVCFKENPSGLLIKSQGKKIVIPKELDDYDEVFNSLSKLVYK
jgi:membrane-associated HD superfamily phosphohydrolase